MAKVVDPSDFSDEQLQAFLDSITRLTYTVDPKLPEWAQMQAESFANKNPKPKLDELRLHIGHAVKTAMGWNDPDDARVMLHAALKSFYLLEWIEHLEKAGKGADTGPALRVAFTPNFRHQGEETPPGTRDATKHKVKNES